MCWVQPRSLLSSTEQSDTPRPGGMRMDDLDRRLIALLRTDARAPI